MSKYPTQGELRILAVMKHRGGTSTIRDVCDVLSTRQRIAYTSVATIARIMLQKGLIRITDERRPQRFEPIYDATDAARQTLRDLIDHAFNGSLTDAVAAVLPNYAGEAPAIAALVRGRKAS